MYDITYKQTTISHDYELEQWWSFEDLLIGLTHNNVVWLTKIEKELAETT